jgi:hypothetical protein
LLLLESLEPAKKITAPQGWRPALEVDGESGWAITPGFADGEKPNFDQFLIDAGFDPAEIEIVGTPRTSRWQVYDESWRTSYRFNFRRITKDADLKLLWSNAKKAVKPPKQLDTDRVLIVCTADYQVGKVGSRGDTDDLLARIFASFAKLEDQMKRGKYSHIYILDAGDIIEGFDNKASMHQLRTNSHSIMDQVDIAASIQFDLIKMAHKFAPVTYASIGSNHCQWRVSGQAVGKPGNDDWGIFITKQLRKLTTETGMKVNYLVPHEYDESLAFDPFGDNFHIIGLAHGHQAGRPESIPNWLDKQVAGLQAVTNFTIFVSGHFHFSMVRELGKAHNGGSRWWIQASTSDNGSDWYRLQGGGSDSGTGITAFELERGKLFTGTVWKL